MNIDEQLVARLLAAQFPQWAALPIRPVDAQGWDNRTFRLGEDMLVRLPSAERYASKVEQEQFWLPKLAPRLPLPIPKPIGMGKSSDEYPWNWSVYQWLEGEQATKENISNPVEFATSLANFLRALQSIDAADGLPAGEHNFYRGGPLQTYDSGTQEALIALEGKIDTNTARKIWETALSSTWQKEPVWVHGDVASGNLLVNDEKLSAVIDFGSFGTGDPSCDLVIAWTLFEDEERAAFKQAMALDEDTWNRARGWALWKACITLANSNEDSVKLEQSRRVLEVLADEQVS